MNKETIDKAAWDYAESIPQPDERRKYSWEDFIAGARWRVNAAWHDAGTELPDSRRDILVLFRGGGFEMTDSGTRFDLWAAVSRWAYVRDLVPDTGKEDGR